MPKAFREEYCRTVPTEKKRSTGDILRQFAEDDSDTEDSLTGEREAAVEAPPPDVEDEITKGVLPDAGGAEDGATTADDLAAANCATSRKVECRMLNNTIS